MGRTAPDARRTAPDLTMRACRKSLFIAEASAHARPGEQLLNVTSPTGLKAWTWGIPISQPVCESRHLSQLREGAIYAVGDGRLILKTAQGSSLRPAGSRGAGF